MTRHAAIIGGSVAGLAAGIALARRGWQATIVERDVSPSTEDGDEAFLLWDRRNVPQFRQPHAFSARSRNLLLEYIPEAVERMRLDGIDEVNLFKMLAPPEFWSDEDDAYAGLWTRRPGFELALRRVAEYEPGLTILSPAAVAGLIADHDGDRLVVTGMSLADGTTVDADVVLDCGGRRAPTPKWLASFGVDLPHESQDCGAVYYSRYYRLSEGSPLSLFGILGVREELERANVIGFPGDHNTYGLAVFVQPDDQELKVLRQDWAWDAFFAALPRVGAWADPTNGTPLTSVQFMGEHQNVRWHPVVEGAPLVHGLLQVGDALCTTNPMYGWGASMALTYSFAAVEAITAHPDDAGAAAVAYDRAVGDEADAVYRESAAMDRIRQYRWNGEEIPEWDRSEAERQDLIFCVAAGALRDVALGRAQLRRMNLLESPGAILDDPTVVEAARHTQAVLAAKTSGRRGPSRAELLERVAAAAPAQ